MRRWRGVRPTTATNGGGRVASDIGIRLVRDRYLALDVLRARTGGGRWFQARMMGRRALVVEGADGVRLFYDPDLVTRSGAIPAPVRLMLFGPGAVHGLNGDEHARRKQLFLDLVDRPAVEDLSRRVATRLDQAASEWAVRGTIRLYDELAELYGRAAIEWAGIGVDSGEAGAVTSDLAAMVDSFGLGGTSYLEGFRARARATRWARGIVRGVRHGTRPAPAGSVVARIAGREDLDGTVAGVELLNVLRPTVAVAYFGAYAAQALSHAPEWRSRLASGSTAELRAFEHEVRRCYPFVPLLAGRFLRAHTWQGRRFERRSWIVLDVMGTNLDPERWSGGSTFDAARFLGYEPDPFEYVPHGGGDPARGHRCPGEPLAVGILEETVRVLAGLDFEIADVDDTVSLDRIPSLPPHRVELRRVRSEPSHADV
jgi:fatty-acid peroxygenase